MKPVPLDKNLKEKLGKNTDNFKKNDYLISENYRFSSSNIAPINKLNEETAFENPLPSNNTGKYKIILYESIYFQLFRE